MKTICVSGTPGTGKTTEAKRLASEKGYFYLDVGKLIFESKLSEGYDKKRQSEIIDIKKLNNALISLIKEKKEKKTKGIVIDSHLSHYLPKENIDLCIITKCSLKDLRERLKKRGYPEKKIRENLDAEIFDVCRIEALEAGHKVKIIDTSKKNITKKS